MVKTEKPTSNRTVQHEKFFTCLEAFAKHRGIKLDKNSQILEFGCGFGEQLKILQDAGYINSAGFEICGEDQDISAFRDSSVADNISVLQLPMNGYTPQKEYSLPFDDNQFDMVFSNVVFEHVMNYELTARELSRITRPAGIHVHLFPSRYRLLEGHTNLFMGGIFHPNWYLKQYTRWSKTYERVWAPRHNPTDSDDAAYQLRQYLVHSCNYLTRGELYRIFRPHFSSVELAEAEFYSCWPGGMRYLGQFMKIPPFQLLHSELRSRALVLMK